MSGGVCVVLVVGFFCLFCGVFFVCVCFLVFFFKKAKPHLTVLNCFYNGELFCWVEKNRLLMGGQYC